MACQTNEGKIIQDVGLTYLEQIICYNLRAAANSQSAVSEMFLKHQKSDDLKRNKHQLLVVSPEAAL